MHQKLKVIQIIDSLAPGGAEMMAVNIANGLSKRGITSFLCATRREGLLREKLYDKEKYIYLNRKKRLDVKSFKSLYKFIKKEDINVVHAHSTSIFIGFMMKICIPRLKLIWHDHYGNSEALDIRRSGFLRIFAKRIDTSIVVNNLLESWNKDILKIKKVINLPNFGSLNKALDKSVDLNGVNGKRIICLANLRPQKDHLTLLKSFIIVQKEFKEWSLHLVGLDLKDAYSKSVHTFIENNNLNNAVFVYGSIKNTYNVLKQSDIGVLSSKSEGLPVALLEYGLVGLPVITTNVGDCNKVIKNKESGLLVISNNEVALRNGLKYLIMNKKRRSFFAENLKLSINEKYSEESYLDKLIAVYLKS